MPATKTSNKAKSTVATRPQPPAPAKGEGSLDAVFDALERVLGRYAPPFQVKTVVSEAPSAADKRSYSLVVPRPVTIPGAYGGKPFDLQLAALMMQKGYVGFYFMPLYMSEGVKAKVSPRLLGLLKGKSCFHVKALDDALLADIEEALKLGVAAYRAKGWL